METCARWLPGWLLDRRFPHPATNAPEPAAPAAGSPTATPAPKTAPTTVVHGFVRTDEGIPVPDAVLTLLSPTGESLDRVATLADGAYILSAPAGGSCLLAATADAYEPWTRHIEVGGEPLVHDLTLSAPPTVSPAHPA